MMIVKNNPNFGTQNIQNKRQVQHYASPISASYGDTVTFKGGINGTSLPRKIFNELARLFKTLIGKGTPKRYAGVKEEVVKEVINGIKGGTSGYRNESGKFFNKDVVKLIAEGYALQLKKMGNTKPVMIAADARDGNEKFLKAVAKVLNKHGFDVIDTGAGTPISVFAQTVRAKGNEVAPINIVFSASHNPWGQFGFNSVTNQGTITPNEITGKITDIIKDVWSNPKLAKVKGVKKGNVTKFDPYETYKKGVEHLVDWKAIKDANITIGYDGLNGTGSKYFTRILEDHGINIAHKMDSMKEGPNPSAENLKDLGEKIKELKPANGLKVGLSNDGDADRFGILDEHGKFVNNNDVILLVLHNMIKNNGAKSGAIIRSHSTSSQLDVLAKKNGLDVIKTPVGFKYIGEEILELKGKAVIGAEESGGLTIKDHIPEKDGIIADLKILELMAKEKKPIGQILSEVKKDLGVTVHNGRKDMKLQNKDGFVADFEKYFNGEKGFDTFAGLKIDLNKTKEEAENIKKFKPNGDGVKLCFEDGSSLLLRKSGTEPIVRYYVETVGKDANEATAKYENFVKEGQAKAKKYE